MAARAILALGEAGNFPAAIKTTAEYFPKKDRAFATSIFNAGASVGALAAPATIPVLAQFFKDRGIGGGWEMAFVIIGALGFVWMGFWTFMYEKPEKSKRVNEAELEYIRQDDEEPVQEEVKTEEKSISFRTALVGGFPKNSKWIGAGSIEIDKQNFNGNPATYLWKNFNVEKIKAVVTFSKWWSVKTISN